MNRGSEYVHRAATTRAGQGAGQAHLADFYDWLSRFVVEHPDEWATVPAAERRALDDWCFARYFEGLGGASDGSDRSSESDLSSPPTEDETIPLDVMLAEIASDERPLYVLPCDCHVLHGDDDDDRNNWRDSCKDINSDTAPIGSYGRQADQQSANRPYKPTHKPLEVCLSYRITPETEAEHPYARRISADEGAAIARRSDRAGLIHTRNPGGYCNCDVRWCYLFRARAARSARCGATGNVDLDPSGWLTGAYIVAHDEAACTNCLRCVQRCQFEVFCAPDTGAGLDVLTTESARCIGCGVCVSSCPAGALSLVKR
jgi:Pyruvate/2-oxoacid:ferredoxin oxidoreductase delta subunit